ncbi:MAG TPA: alpha-L-rhamnosidase N-terminal domain-containing protein, partial [Chitinophagaceae bacterium]|nr:alpha-L-rhamnosidase N-terminal domain-containing protein [Chitinophagaceae bacterium]
MRSMIRYFLITAFLFSAYACRVAGDMALQVTGLTVEGRNDLMGSDIVSPRLSWKIKATDRNVVQTGYRILVASTRENLDKETGDLWDSQQVETDSSLNIRYAGKAFASYQECYWKVQVTTNNGREAWSEPAKWTVGLLDSTEWKAKWIGLDGFNEKDEPESTFTRLAARYLRKEFDLEKKVLSATAYISGMGLYELYLNGKKVGDDVLAPTVSEYNKKIFYNTYDVTDLVTGGSNCAGVILGNGRYFGVRNYHGKPDPLTQIPQV